MSLTSPDATPDTNNYFFLFASGVLVVDPAGVSVSTSTSGFVNASLTPECIEIVARSSEYVEGEVALEGDEGVLSYPGG